MRTTVGDPELVKTIKNALGVYGLGTTDVIKVRFKDLTYETTWDRFCDWFAVGDVASDDVIQNLQILGKGWILEFAGTKWIMRSV